MPTSRPENTSTNAAGKRCDAVCDGQTLIDALGAAGRWLEANSNRINLLNVYPVPDGDTGTNMLLTMQSALTEARHGESLTAGEVILAIYRGALMGARGNSGVILSQMLRGVANTFDRKDALSTSDLASAFQQASETAYAGVITPVEGTMLTVIRDIARAVAKVEGGETVFSMLEKALVAGRRSVATTPELLPVLKDNGVVDAGGEGLCVILEGILRYLRGEQCDVPVSEAGGEVVAAKPTVEEIEGYCTEFLISGSELDLDRIKGRIAALGSSVLVVGDQALVRVHLHTAHPGEALEYGLQYGTLHQIKIDNLEDQHREFLRAHMESERGTMPAEAVSKVSVVAVAAGDGLIEVFKSLGVAEVVSGGETMNPSTDELLQAVERAPTGDVVILPNDRNVVPASRQVSSLTGKAVEVVPTESIPQGISALLAFNYQTSLRENAEAMWAAAQETRTGKVARAARKAKLNGFVVERGQALGVLDGQPVAVGVESGEVALEVLARAGALVSEVITIYYGKDIDCKKAEGLLQDVRHHYPSKQIDLVYGGQPHYEYILSVE